jgi:hypothetical protein
MLAQAHQLAADAHTSLAAGELYEAQSQFDQAQQLLSAALQVEGDAAARQALLAALQQVQQGLEEVRQLEQDLEDQCDDGLDAGGAATQQHQYGSSAAGHGSGYFASQSGAPAATTSTSTWQLQAYQAPTAATDVAPVPAPAQAVFDRQALDAAVVRARKLLEVRHTIAHVAHRLQHSSCQGCNGSAHVPDPWAC